MCRSVETLCDKKMQQGIEQGKIDTAISMLKEKAFTLKLISKICKLPMEKIEQLQKELEENDE